MKIGQTLRERYTIVQSIKVGGMGAVFLARDGNLGDSLCAVKQMLDLGADSADYLRAKFEAEMQSLVKLQHPGIPRVRDFFIENQSVFLVMDYIEGKNLEEIQEEAPGKVLEASVAVEVARQVLDVLAYMHAQDPAILHRDIKPSNLIRDDQTGTIKVVDFGLARASQGNSPQTSVGTLGFCAPEQISGQATPASDVYSVGVTLHVMVTGQRPAIMGLTDLKKTMAQYDHALAQIIEKATELDASQRYPGAREMQRALQEWLNPPTVPQSQRHPETIVAPAASPARSKKVYWVAALALVFLAIFGATRITPKPPAKKNMVKPVASATSKPAVTQFEGPVFGNLADEGKHLITLGEDIGLLWVEAAGKQSAAERSKTIAERLNGLYHYRCGQCGNMLLEPDGILIGKCGKETVLFYAHLHGESYAVSPYLIATIDNQTARRLNTTPKFVAGHWRNLMRDVVALSRGGQAKHSGLGSELAPVIEVLKEQPKGTTLSNNLKAIMGEIPSSQANSLKSMFRSIPPELKVKVDSFPEYQSFKPLKG